MPAPDGQVDAYQRVVNGKVVKVNAYSQRSTTTTRAAAAVRRLPGRPRIAASPGSYTSGRDLPGMQAQALPPEPPQVPPKGPGNARPPAPK